MAAAFLNPYAFAIPEEWRSQTAPPPDLTPEEEESVLSKIGHGALSGLQTVGAILGTPMSIVENTLAGENPLKGLFNPQERTTGAELLHRLGLVEDPHSWSGIGAGLAADILLDPFSWLSGGASALSKLGKAGKSAGLLERLPIKAQMAGLPAGIGPRGARIGMSMNDIMRTAHDVPEAQEMMGRLADAVAKRGIQITPEMMAEPLGTAMALRLPFTDTPILRFGTAETPLGRGIAKGLDVAGSAAMAPFRWLGPSFEAAVRKAGTTPGQEWAKEATARETAGISKARMATIGLGSELYDMEKKYGVYAPERMAEEYANISQRAAAGASPEEIAQAYADVNLHMGEEAAAKHREAIRASQGSEVPVEEILAYEQKVANPYDPLFLRGMLEGQRPAPSQLQDSINAAREQYFPELFRQMRKEGVNVGEEADYFPRFMARTGMLKPGETPGVPGGLMGAARRGKAWETMDPSVLHRSEAYKGAVGGSEREAMIISDPKFSEMIERGAKQKEIAEHIRTRYVDAGLLEDPILNAEGEITGLRSNELAKEILKIPKDVREAGLFANHPVADMLISATRGESKKATNQTILDMLAHGRVMGAEGVPVSDVLKSAGIDTQLAIPEIASRAGMDASAVAASRVPANIAADIAKYKDVVASPESMNEILAKYRDFTAFWKAFVTGARPGFYPRNFASGQISNMLHSQWSPSSLYKAGQFIYGKDIEGAQHIPVINRMLKEAGLEENAANGTEMLRRLVQADSVVDKYTGQALELYGSGENVGSTLASVMEGGPGREQFSFKRMMQKFLGIGGQGTSWKDITGIRGVRNAQGIPRTATTFAPIAAGEELSYATEAMNRIAPYIKLLEDGVDHNLAVARVMSAQATYKNRYFTPVEQTLTRYLFPFYRFSKSMAKDVVGELTSDPGGRMAQMIKAMNASHGTTPLTPDYMARSLMVPMPSGESGDKRFLTSLGLMMEDPLQFMAGPVGMGAVQEAGSRMNPFIKAPLEWGLGRTFFQAGESGGRNLGEMDPLLGRVIANVSGAERPPNWAFGSPWWTRTAEQALANSPVSPWLSNIRTLTDPRKTWGPALTNVLSGVKITDLPQRTQDAMLDDIIQAAKRNMGAKAYTSVYFPKGMKEQMGPADLEQAGYLENLTKLLNSRAKARAAQKVAA